MSAHLSLIESATRRRSGESPTGVFQIRPQVVDTSSLLPDVVAASRTHHQTRFLAAVRFGSVRPFAGSHVWAEMPRKIEERAEAMDFSPRLAEAIWWEKYVPYVRFVDVYGLPQPRPEILVRDATDAATVALAGLVGRVVVTASDADLRDIGVAAADWFATIEAGYALSVAGTGAWGGVLSMQLGGYGVASAGRSVIRVVRNPVGQLALLALAIGLLLTRDSWVPRLRSWSEDLGPRLDRAVETVVPVIDRVIADYRAAEDSWANARFQSDETGLVHEAAQVLASSPHALSRTEITRRLLPDATQRDRREVMRQLADLLEAYPAFVRVNTRDWQLGRAGMDFGRPQRSTPLLHSAPMRPW